jgi:hypothetical protein
VGRAVTILVAAALAACAKPPTAAIESPTEGETVTGAVRVTLSAVNVEIAAAAENRPGTAHHHLFLDVDVTPPGVAIPMAAEGIVHLGRGQTEWTYDSLARGPHRVIAVLAGPDHVPLRKGAADTVNFIVGPWP